MLHLNFQAVIGISVLLLVLHLLSLLVSHFNNADSIVDFLKPKNKKTEDGRIVKSTCVKNNSIDI